MAALADGARCPAEEGRSGFTYAVGGLAAPLQPDARAGGNSPWGELHAVVPRDLQFPRERTRRPVGVLGLREKLPPVRPILALAVTFSRRREERPDVPQHLQVPGPPIAGCRDDEVDVQCFQLGTRERILAGSARASLSELSSLHDQPETVTLLLRSHYVIATHDAVWPSRLVLSQLSSLVVHSLVEGLNELQPHYAVVRTSRVGEQVATVLGRLWVKRINVFGVEDGVYAVRVRSRYPRATGSGTYKGESSLGLRNSDRITSHVRELGYNVWMLLKISAALWPAPTTATR